MTYYCQYLFGALRRGDPEMVYETCGEALRWDGEQGLSCPDHGPRRIAERLQPIHLGSVILEPSEVCTI